MLGTNGSYFDFNNSFAFSKEAGVVFLPLSIRAIASARSS